MRFYLRRFRVEPAGQPGPARQPRPTRIFIWFGLALAAAIASGTVLFLLHLRDRTVAARQRELRNIALVLAEETDRTFQSLDLVQSGLIERMRAQRIASPDAYRKRLSRHDVHLMLRDAINGMPHVDAITLIDDNGKLINFSRYWPIPAVNVADRDYFIALLVDPGLDSFVSRPVPNRGTGTWTIYLARKIRGPDGEFLGLMLGAMQLDYFERFYQRIALGGGSTIAMLRRDGTLLARHPHLDPSIGRSYLTEGNFGLILDHVDQGAIRLMSAIDGQERLLAAHSVAHFPLVVTASTTVAAALAGWRDQAIYVGVLAGFTILVIGLSVSLAAVMLARQMRDREQLARAEADKEKALSAQIAAEADREIERRRVKLERQLQQFQKMDALGTLAGGIAHDLNNTLVPILALTKLTASRLPAESRERGNLATVTTAAERARDLVKQILAFSREDKPEKHKVDVAAIVRNALAMLRASLPSTLRIDAAIGPTPPILADPGQIHQIILNLVMNAAQAIGAQMGTITVKLATEPAAAQATASVVHLSVADTGCGMSDAVLERIFEPFFTTRAVGEGTGLGLSVVHGIVTDHGGRIKVESTVGSGTRLDVYLPAGAPRASGNASRASEPALAAPSI